MPLMPKAVALADRVDALLPQTQCMRCGYDACRPYAEAVAAGTAPINRCPPGGESTIAALAELLGIPTLPLDASRGPSEPLQVARIDEAACIGCTLCIRACPVDAIVGAVKLMHTVLEGHCTGCGLCLPPCPVDCIVMADAGRNWGQADAEATRRRFAARNARPALRPLPHEPDLRAAHPLRDATREDRRRTVAAALVRARARRARASSDGSGPGA